jgi:hypothetical protein
MDTQSNNPQNSGSGAGAANDEKQVEDQFHIDRLLAEAQQQQPQKMVIQNSDNQSIVTAEVIDDLCCGFAIGGPSPAAKKKIQAAENNDQISVPPTVIEQELNSPYDEPPTLRVPGPQHVDEYEVVLNKDDPEAQERKLNGVGVGSDASTADDSSLDLSVSTRRETVAVVGTANAIEAQNCDDGEVSVSGKTESLTIVKPNKKKRRYWLLLLLCIALLLAIAALITGLVVRNNRQNQENDDDDEPTVRSVGNWTNTTDEENVIDVLQEAMSTGCFQYDNGMTVCFFDEDPTDNVCLVTVDGQVCASCTVCDMATGAARVDCTNVLPESAIVNDDCENTPGAFECTFMAAFVNDEGLDETCMQGSWVDEEEEPELTSPNFPTGCFDYNFRLNDGVIVCLFDDEPNDDLCTVLVDGEQCESCVVCDTEAGVVSADCGNLGYGAPNAPINEGCAGDRSSYEGTLLHAFMGESDPNDGSWVELDNFDFGQCTDKVETDFKCYGQDTEEIQVSFMNCEPLNDDWIGFFPASVNPNTLGNAVNNVWRWACDAGQECEGEGADSDIFTFDQQLPPGSYRAFLIRRLDGPDMGFAWSAPFEVKESSTQC